MTHRKKFTTHLPPHNTVCGVRNYTIVERFIRVFYLDCDSTCVVLECFKIVSDAFDTDMEHSEELGSVPTKLEFDVASLEKYLKTQFPHIFKASVGPPQFTVKFFKYCAK